MSMKAISISRFVYGFACLLLFHCLVTCECSSAYAGVLAEQLHQFCDWRQGLANGSLSVAPTVYRGGKAGPRGPPGLPGPAGTVDHSVVEKMVNRSLQDAEDRISELSSKVEHLQNELNKLTRIDCTRVSKKDAKLWDGKGGVFDIYPDQGRQMEVYCDMDTDGGGWTVIQRRINGSENFQRNYADYAKGFGKADGEYWIGLEQLHTLTTRSKVEMRVDLLDWENNTAYALYFDFSVGDAPSQYVLHVSEYSGTAGDSMTYHHGQAFYTKDRDNGNSCATNYKGGWWYKGCFYANLNGIYLVGGDYSYTNSHSHGVEWYHWKGKHGYSVKTVEMKIRPKW